MLDSDPVIDYMVMEAVAIKVNREELAAAEKKKRDEWRSNRDHLKEHQ